ncbi:MotA/TolQ/ExbB proton channel family protein [Hydrogenimonas thermophila]|uniref:MotA/TolQ/ExbB proton channel family protein n=1 Tax=Hydrogenimonas thermophila TaxID=223786 RepID=UPI002936DCFF|nr:MotA/TolQ/ExbB proton channel family protein [Hydrogenimonas thermophila]WOE69386.1 MotA/TolQ/ExbB proton channel family protein [Hydrogenimonas thermophila]WOE71896.1 MotA/TolQ/ExbB proton channel family protein [Hydrogenimonas thermophila]
MKKIILTVLTFTLLSATLNAAPSDENRLEKAYAKEFAFLKAQKEMLKKRLKEVKRDDAKKIEIAKREIEKLQESVIAKNLKVEKLNNELFELQRNVDNIESDTQLIESVITQGNSLLKQYGQKLKVYPEDYPKTLKTLFDTSLNIANRLSTVRSDNGNFYLKDGSEKSGLIIKVGNIATYGISDTVSGSLVPAGDGKFKIWDETLSAQTAKVLASGKLPDTLNIFIYENSKKEIADKEEKTALDVVESGGIIGWVIVGLGVVGVLLILLRVLFLSSASSKTMKIAKEVSTTLQSKGLDSALNLLKARRGAAARVLKAVVRNLDRDREHIEDIVTESLIHESERLDKYGTAIMVIAAVSPLLGLLGTVTGMIATFDIITEFGTGDPKLLSGGISIALVTTELGLIVAIPLLLLGNLLNGWSERIKDEIEASALHIINQYNK